MADVLSLAADGDPGVWRLPHLGRTIGRSLADFCVSVAPDGVVLDGLLQNAGFPVIDGIRLLTSDGPEPETWDPVDRKRLDPEQLGSSLCGKG